MTHAVTGWGYEGHTIEDLLDECERLRAAYVVDIRLNAISRKKGFSKTALSNALAGAGVEYVHLRALGNPKDNRPGFAHPGTPEADRQLGELAELTRRGNVIILCFEETPKCCHRHLVIQRLQAREKTVAFV